jgi:hypothetical protein
MARIGARPVRYKDLRLLLDEVSGKRDQQLLYDQTGSSEAAFVEVLSRRVDVFIPP